MDNSSKTRAKGQGPWITKVEDLRKHQKVAERMDAFVQKSNVVLKTFKSQDYLPILHIQPEGHPDHLLRLHFLLRAVIPQRTFLPGRTGRKTSIVPAGALIVVDSSNNSHEGFKQACWVAHEQSKGYEAAIFKGAGYLFGNVAVIRGLTGRLAPTNSILRIEQSIRNLVNKTGFMGVIWHECSSIALLNHMARSASSWHSSLGGSHLKAITISSGLSMEAGILEILPGLPSKAVTENFMKVMQEMKIPIVFVDEHMLGIHSNLESAEAQSDKQRWYSFSTLLPGFSHTWPFVLPPAATEPILKENMDDLAVSVYRLQAKYSSTFSKDVINQIKKELSFSKSKYWAIRTIKEEEFEKEKCEELGFWEHMLEIWPNASAPLTFSLADLPGALLHLGCGTDALMALRVEIDFSGPRFRARHDESSTTYVLVSRDPQHAINSLHTQWCVVQQHLVPQGKMAMIDKGVANTWLHLAKALGKRLEYMFKGKDFRKWNKRDQEMFESIWWQMMNGGMSGLSAWSMGQMTPKAYWT